MKGLILSVYRPASGADCTNGGVSGQYTDLIVVGYQKLGSKEIRPLPDDCRVFTPEHQDQAVVLVESKYGLRLVPLGIVDGGPPPNCVGPMMGGNYGGSSDSRWARLGKLFDAGRLDAVPIHDRVESHSQYKVLSF